MGIDKDQYEGVFKTLTVINNSSNPLSISLSSSNLSPKKMSSIFGTIIDFANSLKNCISNTVTISETSNSLVESAK